MTTEQIAAKIAAEHALTVAPNGSLQCQCGWEQVGFAHKETQGNQHLHAVTRQAEFDNEWPRRWWLRLTGA